MLHHQQLASEKMKNLMDWFQRGGQTLCHPAEVDPTWSNKINTNNWHIIQLPNIKQARLSITKKLIVIKGTTIISVLCFIYRFLQ